MQSVGWSNSQLSRLVDVRLGRAQERARHHVATSKQQDLLQSALAERLDGERQVGVTDAAIVHEIIGDGERELLLLVEDRRTRTFLHGRELSVAHPHLARDTRV